MSNNAERMAAELAGLGYDPRPFTAPQEQGGAEGVQFKYVIKDGSRTGEMVTLAVALHENEGQWPEVAPHWVYVSPPDRVLAEQVKGAASPGVVAHYEGGEGETWMAVSAPPSDFWDEIDARNGKNMETYLERHICRIWEAR